MRYSSINHWYKVEEVLSGLEGTSSEAVQKELLRHLGSARIQRFESKGKELNVRVGSDEILVWTFKSDPALERFVSTICEWFESQKVAVPAH